MDRDDLFKHLYEDLLDRVELGWHLRHQRWDRELLLGHTENLLLRSGFVK